MGYTVPALVMFYFLICCCHKGICFLGENSLSCAFMICLLLFALLYVSYTSIKVPLKS